MSLHKNRLQQLAQQELDAHRQHQKLVEVAQQDLRQRLGVVEKQRERLVGHEDDPEVLVRNGPGPAVEIFHAADDYCRRVNPTAVAQSRYKRLLLFEALEQGLRSCSACASHLQSRRRPTDQAA